MLGVQQKKEIYNEHRYYLRFHNSISRAIELNKLIFGDTVGKDGKEPAFQHSLRVAGHCEEILDQTMEQYHMSWLVGILHDNKQKDPILFSEKIDQVLEDLMPQERNKIQQYIDDLTSNKTLSKGEQKRQQLIKVEKMDLIPSWILIFDKYDNCKRFKNNPCGKSRQELDGYFSVAYLIYVKARNHHSQIRKFILPEIHQFYEALGKSVGGEEGAVKCSERYFKMFD